ncbi:hypothetical protein CASFOL_029205 [Castilleja foliolosa]|uniref:Uncharacterized protein n=1 Tax=Castilleja foliolosa TaxID=1961234 RepID=A0ABD3CBQ5_9LAMI
MNKDFYSVDYDSLDVATGYRGKRLGFMTSDGGLIKARRYSYVNATPQLYTAETLSDAIYLNRRFGERFCENIVRFHCKYTPSNNHSLKLLSRVRSEDSEHSLRKRLYEIFAISNAGNYVYRPTTAASIQNQYLATGTLGNADEDQSIVEVEEDESLPDRSNLKPHFHSSHFNGSEDEEDEDENTVNVWNLSKCSATSIDFLSNVRKA